MARVLAAASSQYLENTTAVATVVPLTMACWFKTTSATPAGTQTLMQLTNSGAQQGFGLFQAVTTGVIAAQTFTPTNDAAVSTTNPAANTWSHACGVWASATDRRAFLNGGNKGTNATNLTPTGVDHTEIGSYLYSGGRILFWDGSLAEAAIWNIALTDADVAMLGLGISPLLVRPDALVAYWPLIGVYSPETDRMVGAHNLTLGAAPVQGTHVKVFAASGGQNC